MRNYSFFIGCDISKEVIDVAARLESKSIYIGQFENSPEGFTSWLNELSSKTEIPIEQWFVCFENTGPYSKLFLHWLTDNGITCCEENPIKISRSLGLRRGKNDKIDSIDICTYLFEKRDSIKATNVDNPLISNLKILLARRRILVKQKSALSVSLKEQKSIMDAELFDMLQEVNNKLLSLYKKQIRLIESEIDQLISKDEKALKNHKLACTVIGVGPITSAYIISRTDNYKVYVNPRKFACYCGIAPFAISSGKKKGSMRVNHMANKKLKSLFSNCVLAAIAHDPEIKKYYNRKIQSGKKPGVVLNAVKNKLIQRVFAVVKRQTPYVKINSYAQ